MKVILMFGVLLALVLGGSLPATASYLPDTRTTLALPSGNNSVIIPLDDNDNGAVLDVDGCDEIVVRLESNHSTGFSWQLAGISDTAVLKLMEYEWVPPEPVNPPVSGRPGTEIWTFKVFMSGTSEVTLEYAQPWSGIVIDTYNFSVNAAPAKAPASSATGLWLMIAGLAGMMALILWRNLHIKARSGK